MTHEEFVTNIITRISFIVDSASIEQIRMSLYSELSGKEIVENETLPSAYPVDNEKLIRRFLATKNIEGCSKGTLSAYGFGIRKFAEFLDGFDLKDVTTDMIRMYLGNIASKNQNSYADTIRRYLNSFYQWAENEDIIFKNPCKKIKHLFIAICPLSQQLIRDSAILIGSMIVAISIPPLSWLQFVTG